MPVESAALMRQDRAHRPTIAWLALLGVVLCLFGAHVGGTWSFTVDDAGISYSYARNLWRGYGLVLTPGSERVEAATNFLWVLLLSPADGLGVSHELLSKVLGLAFGGMSLGAIALFPAAAYARRPRYYDLLAPIAAATFAHVAVWTASGLENGLFSFLAALSLLFVADEENETERFPWSSVSLGLLFATRPDGGLYAAAVGGAKMLRVLAGRGRRQDVHWALATGLCFGALELFRLAYFAYPVPNSFYTKKRTFDFGKDLTSFTSAGWTYVKEFLATYKLKKALYVIPAVALAVRAPVARAALLFCVAAGVFLPVYSHGDWMEEWRFLTYVTPIAVLAIAEGLRALIRVVAGAFPGSGRTVVAWALAPVAGYFLLSETTRSYPERLQHVRSHETLDFATVRGRARYFAAATRALDLHGGSVVDPDVGGMSYDSGLQVIDLFGLGDVAVARTHPVDEPGLREAVFGERRPTFVHLHGAWYAAVMFERLEELDQFYLRMPSLVGVEHDEGGNYVRREVLAAPWTEEAERGPAFSTKDGGYIEGYTVSAHGLEPGQGLTVEVTFSGLSGAAGSIVAEPMQAPGAGAVTVALRPAGDVIAPSSFMAGERPWARARVQLPRGRYDLRWRSAAADASLGTVLVAPGAGLADVGAARQSMRASLQRGQLLAARRTALGLRLRLRDTPDDASTRETLAMYARALAERAITLGARGVFPLAAELAQQARQFGGDDPQTQSAVQRLAERMADEARARQRAHDDGAAFDLARDAVLIDPRRSWMRRHAEELRAHRLNAYDGGRDLAAYRFAASSLDASTQGAEVAAGSLDRALIMLGAVGRHVDAAALVDRTAVAVVDPRARVVVARGRLARGEVNEAVAMVSGQSCSVARDPVVTRGIEALTGRAFRSGDPWCTRPVGDAGVFAPTSGSFESARWVGWTATGRAFGAGPIHDTPTTQTFVNGWRGQRYASSYARGTDTVTGRLTSRPFVIDGEGISFLVAGGGDATQVGVRLIVDGASVLQHAGGNGEGFRRVFWDVRPYRGHTATLEVYDDSIGGWGHIMADDFVAEPVYPGPAAQHARDADAE